MKIAFTTAFNAQDIRAWSGTPFYMAKAFESQAIHLDYIGSLERKITLPFKIKRTFKKLLGQKESLTYNPVLLKHYAKQVADKLRELDTHIVFAPILDPLFYLECEQPIIFWTDALYANLLGFYPGSHNNTSSSILNTHALTEKCLARARLAIFSSEWAARCAIERYGADQKKIKVVPFGANIDNSFDFTEIKTIIHSRSRHIIKLLFLGKNWYRKGGDTVLNVAKALHAAGHAVELTIVGCVPPAHEILPTYVKCLGYISKHTTAGMTTIFDLLCDTHFLFVPSRAEAYGIVFCEANAFGVPCLTSCVGGIATVVKNNINGMAFSLDTLIPTYCAYITDLMHHYARYEELALSAFNEYKTRLNWNTATKTVKALMQEAITY